MEQVASLRDALANGTINYHAFPHNAELEVGNPDVIAAGIQLVHNLDARLSLPLKRTLSQRDVPGITRAIIPLLRKQGITAVSVGVNGASMFPRVPKIFRWLDPISGASIIAMWHPRGYGGFSVDEAVRVEGFDHALVTDWNTKDNGGPLSAQEYVEHFEQIQREFPGAHIVASTFDNYTSQLVSSGATSNLPTHIQEIGDSWIYGVQSDARKQAYTRVLHRSWSTYLAQGGKQDDTYWNATRFMLKNIEHTWGADAKDFLNYSSASWRNTEFEAQRQQPKVMSLEARLEHAGESWASSSHPLLGLLYRVYSVADYATYLRAYSGMASPPQWFVLDFSKFQDDSAISASFGPRLTDLWTRAGAEAMDAQGSTKGKAPTMALLRLELRNASKAREEYGAAAAYFVRVALVTDNEIDVTLTVVEKTPTRHAEALFVHFHPPQAAHAESGSVKLNKLGQWLPATRNLTTDGGSKVLHGTSGGVRFVSPAGAHLTIESLDSAVICLGTPNGFPVALSETDPWAPPDVANDGLSSMLVNNLWGTNYVMWQPFHFSGVDVPSEANLAFRYRMRFDTA